MEVKRVVVAVGKVLWHFIGIGTCVFMAAMGVRDLMDMYDGND